MHVAIDYRSARYGRGGIAVYVRELVRALAALSPPPKLALYARQWRRSAADRLPPEEVEFPAHVRLHAARIPSRLVPWLALIGCGLRRSLGGPELVHQCDYTVLPTASLPVVSTIHDVLFHELPDCYTPSMRSGLQSATARLVEQSRALIVPTTRTRRELLAHYPVEADRVHVVPHGHRRLAGAEGSAPPTPYVLTVGTLEPRKNHLRVIDAVASVRRRHPELTLVMAGARGWQDEALIERITRTPWIRYEGVVSDGRLATLFDGAALLAYPSLGEGFGLPVLEALARGRAVLTSRDTACSDVAGEAALCVDPRETDALADGIARLLGDRALSARLVSRGPEVARAYTWEETARRTYAVYHAALAAGASS